MRSGLTADHKMSHSGQASLPQQALSLKPFASSVETLLEGITTSPRLCYNCGKMSPTWTRTPTDSNGSPSTMVNETFEALPVLGGATVADFWSTAVENIFKQVPYGPDERFLEEFQYAVVSSDLLGDLNRWRPPHADPLHENRSHQYLSQDRVRHLSIPTKYGRLQVSSNDRFRLRGNFRYRATLFCARRLLKRLQYVSGPRRRILATLLIALYLSFQEEYFKAQYTKQRALFTLNSMLDSLQRLSVLQHNHFALFREGTVSRIAMADGMLSSSLDLLYYSMENVTLELLPLSSSSELTKYCGIYNVPLEELFYRLAEPATDAESRFARVKILRNFMLCCLLSQNHDRIVCDLSMCTLLHKIFPNCTSTQHVHSNEIERLKLVTSNLQQLQSLTHSLTISMLKHTELLHRHRTSMAVQGENTKRYSKLYLKPNGDMSQGCQSPTDVVRGRSGKLSATLQSLRELERLLIVADEEAATSEPTRKIVKGRLTDLLGIWQDVNDVTNSPMRDNRLSVNKYGNRGLSLDVVKTSVDFNIACGGPQAPKLDDQVDVTHVEDTHSDLELDSDYEVFREAAIDLSNDDGDIENAGDNEGPGRNLRSSEDTFINHQVRKFSQLNDEELRKKLNEGISRFAEENRQGRQILRNQKSFELLRQHKSNDWATLGGIRQISSASELTLKRSILKHKISAEETIPIFYELQEILDK